MENNNISGDADEIPDLTVISNAPMSPDLIPARIHRTYRISLSRLFNNDHDRGYDDQLVTYGRKFGAFKKSIETAMKNSSDKDKNIEIRNLIEILRIFLTREKEFTEKNETEYIQKHKNNLKWKISELEHQKAQRLA